MKVVNRLAACALSVLALAFANSGFAVEVSCPARINIQPIVVNDVPEGWRVSQNDASLPVWGAGVTVGPLEEGGQFKPDVYTQKGRKVMKWTFTPADNARGIWLTCGYGGAPVELARKLPIGISTCSAYEPVLKKGTWNVIAICH
jgi:hypothetical protein